MGRSEPANGSGCECTRISPSACSISRRHSPPSERSRCSSGSGSTARAIPAGCSARRSRCRPAVLGSADAYQSMREPRPHRERARPEQAARELRAEVKAGRMDGDVVEAVLGAAGHRVARRREGPAGLTAREVDVLRLVSRGLSSKDIAARLVISPKTVRNHIEHIYVKIGVSNRAGASLFAMQHGLLPDEGTLVS